MQITNHIQGKHGKPILYDVRWLDGGNKLPIVIFAHGFKGYKDWGCWNLVAEAFANAGYLFVKFNFSHNGGTIEQPIDFPDLEAFGNNNYLIELDDLGSMVSHVRSQYSDIGDTGNMTLIGHSRGGGICVLGAHKYRVQKLVIWASIANIEERLPHDKLEEWNEQRVLYVFNGRTMQNMPMHYQFYETIVQNRETLNIEKAARATQIPTLIAHGMADESVSPADATRLNSWIKGSELLTIQDANHTFGSKQPWKKKKMPRHLQWLTNHTIDFIKKQDPFLK